MGSSGEDFLLKWNDHHSLFFAGAEELCHSDEYTDCTLAAGQKFFSAHKLVLSICSPFFRALFKRLGSNNKTVIFLKDVEPGHLELLLEYMYKGEIKVQESELVNVLNAAQSLEVKGLTDNGQKSEPKPAAAKPEVPRAASTKRPSPAPVAVEPPKRSKPAAAVKPPPPVVIAPTTQQPAAAVAVKEEQQEVIPITEDEQEENMVEEWGAAAATEGADAATAVDYGGGGDYADDGNYGGGGGTVATGYEELGGYEGEEYYGGDEGVMAVGEGDDRTVVQLGRGRGKGLSVCPYCIKDFKTPSLLQRHITVHTKEKKYVCVCGRGYTRPDRYRKHTETCAAAAANIRVAAAEEEMTILIDGVNSVTEVHSSDTSP